MSCLPGTPCFENTVNAFYPKKCDNGWFKGYPIAATDVKYNGPNLPNSGVDTGDSLVVALEKLDNTLDPYTIARQTLYMIFQNTDLIESFCTLTGFCVPTTTTSTTLPL
jgi:hypothetical protein